VTKIHLTTKGNFKKILLKTKINFLETKIHLTTKGDFKKDFLKTECN
jgi:hypothetical protein